MNTNDKPAASCAAGSAGDAFSWQATRESRERLHAATAAIFDAASIERRALMCGRRA